MIVILYRNLLKFIKEEPDFLKLSIVMCVASMCGPTARFILPVYFSQKGFNTTEIGLLMSLSGFSGIISGIISGRLSDRIGRKPLIYVGLLSYSVPWIILWQAPVKILFYVAMFAEGFSLQVFFTAIYAFISDAFIPERRGMAMGVFWSSMGVGMILGPLLLINIIYKLFGEAAFFFICILFFVGTGSLVYFFVSEPRFKHVVNDKVSGEKLSTKHRLPSFSRSCYIYLIAAIFLSIGQSMNMSMFSLFLTDVGVDVAGISLIYSLSAIITSIFPVIFGKLSDKYGRKKFLVAGRIMTSISSLMYTMYRLPSGILAFRLLYSVAGSISTSVGLAYLTELLPENNQGLGIGLYNSLLRIDSSLMAVVGGVVVQYYGFNTMFLIEASTAILSAGLVQFGVQSSNKIKKSNESSSN